MEDDEQIIKTWSDLQNHQEVWPEAPFEKGAIVLSSRLRMSLITYTWSAKCVAS